MKIVKHGDIEFYAGLSKIAGETCQGILTGLIAMEDKERRLEVTNWYVPFQSKKIPLEIKFLIGSTRRAFRRR